MTKNATSQDPPRRRRSPEVARQEILDAAQHLLSQGGPDAIRLQDIASDVGIAHPTILHHFGSREGLIRALDVRAIEGLTGDVAQLLQSERELRPGKLVERLAQTMDQQGLARLIALWAMRSSEAESPNNIDPAALVQEVSQLIQARLGAVENVPQELAEAISFRVRLAVFAMFGEALVGDVMSPVSGEKREAERERFRRWLSDLLIEGNTYQLGPANPDTPEN